MKHLYRFFWDCGRMGDVEGLFIATDLEVAEALGKYVYLGEALGKHSEISGVLEAGDVEIISDAQEEIEWLSGIFGRSVSGYNPLDYIQDEE